MAFLRKHRERYWLVHNFRVDGKVQQVRVYPFDLHEDLDGEIARAQNAMASCHRGQIAPTWVEPVRQRLQHIQKERQWQHRERQVQQVHEQMADVVRTLDLLPAPPQEKNRLIRECIAQLQGRLAQENPEATFASMQKTAHPPDASRHDALHAGGSTARSEEVGKGFYLRDSSLYHACMEEQPLFDDAAPGRTGNQQQALSPVVWVSLIQGRDLWLECHTCHARWHNLSQLTQFTRLKLHRQKISKFDRFCKEHRVGDSCDIFIPYRSGHVDRLHGIIQDIDYETKKVLVVSTRGRSRQTYWRNFDNVHFGHLEVRLTDAQQAHVVSAGKAELTHLVYDWYAVADTPGVRLFLQQLGVRY